MIGCLSLLFFDFVVEVSSTSSFCSNPDALVIDESEKGIFFYSLRNIAQLPPSPPKEDDRLGNFATGTVGDLALGEEGKESPAVGTGEWLYEVRSSGFWSFFY